MKANPKRLAFFVPFTLVLSLFIANPLFFTRSKYFCSYPIKTFNKPHCHGNETFLSGNPYPVQMC
jgi:hypothetical protein